MDQPATIITLMFTGFVWAVLLHVVYLHYEHCTCSLLLFYAVNAASCSAVSSWI